MKKIFAKALPGCGLFLSRLAKGIGGPAADLLVDLISIPVNPHQAAMPGDTWNFQCWYRDVGNSSNFTDAIAITYQ